MQPSMRARNALPTGQACLERKMDLIDFSWFSPHKQSSIRASGCLPLFILSERLLPRFKTIELIVKQKSVRIVFTPISNTHTCDLVLLFFFSLVCMCFVKKVCLNCKALFDTQPQSSLISPVESWSDNHATLAHGGISQMPPPIGAASNVLMKALYNLVSENSQNLMKLNTNMSHFGEMVNACLGSINKKMADEELGTEPVESEGWRSKEEIIERQFGTKHYKYKFKLLSKLHRTLYKDRNLNIAVNLVDHQGKIVFNSNLLSIGVTVCDTEGNWVPDTEEGESFIRGKSQAEMYHGEASFLKVHPRGVTRNMPQGKTHFIIYAKPSLIRFNPSSSAEQQVNANEIEPLMIKDITIRAKKKRED